MFVDILKNKIEAVVVTDIQKLMYSTKDAAKVFKMLNELGTSVIVVEQGLEYDQAFMGMYPQFIRLEHLLIGNQMREGRAAAKAKGVKFGRSRTPMSEETLKIITTMDKAGRSVRDITAATGISEGVVMGRLQELKKKED
jgi:DNA invertase Pin-like site-specific DNA recombinase